MGLMYGLKPVPFKLAHYPKSGYKLSEGPKRRFWATNATVLRREVFGFCRFL